MIVKPAALDPGDMTRNMLRGRRVDLKGMVFEGALLLALLVALAILVVLLFDQFSRGWGVLAERGTSFLQGPISSFSPAMAGIKDGLIGSALTLIFVVLVAIPLGVGAAIYLEEYAPNTRFTRFVTVNVRNLAGVPSIVYGLLGLALFVQVLGPVTGGSTAMAGGLTLAVLVLPIVIITASEAVRAVPQSIREAGYGVGATRWEVIRHHVLPSAAPGILTGTILSISRAIGESAPVIMVGAVLGSIFGAGGDLASMLRGPFTTLPTVVYTYSRQPNAAFREVTAATIIVLLAVIILANATAIILRNRYERKW
jgi:phosphate transport system permease protein